MNSVSGHLWPLGKSGIVEPDQRCFRCGMTSFEFFESADWRMAGSGGELPPEAYKKCTGPRQQHDPGKLFALLGVAAILTFWPFVLAFAFEAWRSGEWEEFYEGTIGDIKRAWHSTPQA